nr:hypothetical protein [Kofleriaceae bacterium]
MPLKLAPLFVLVAAACGGPVVQTVTAPPASTAQDGSADCARAGSNVAHVLDIDAEHAPALAAIVEHHCRADAWPAVAQKCVAAAADHAAALQCAYKHLTEEQHDLVVRDMRPLLPASPPGDHPDGPGDAPAVSQPGSQADIAERDAADAADLVAHGRYSDASAKLRDAAARVPEPRYFVDLCDSLAHEGKYGEALVACAAAGKLNPPAALQARITELTRRVTAAARTGKLP